MLSAPELILIGIVTLMVFGPKRLPEVAKGLGRGIREFKKSMNGEDEESSSEVRSLACAKKDHVEVASREQSQSKAG
jgi:sec-independent protein translocase protein TatA